MLTSKTPLLNRALLTLFINFCFFSLYAQNSVCDCQDFLYVNDPAVDITHKFIIDESDGGISGEIGNPWLTTDVIVNAHGVAPDINGNLYISQLNQPNDPTTNQLFKLDCDGNVVDPNFIPNWGAFYNKLSIGNFLYTSGWLEGGLEEFGVYQYDLCTKQQTGFLRIAEQSASEINWGMSQGEDGNIYVTTSWGGIAGNHNVYRVAPDLSSLELVITVPNSDASIYTLGVDTDEYDNIYFIVTNAGTDGATTVYKYDRDGNFIHSIVDPVLNESGFGGAWGIQYYVNTGKLYIGTLGDDCVAVIDAGGENGSMVYQSNLGIPHSPGTYSKALNIVKECCPVANNMVVDSTLCNVPLNEVYFLQDLIDCDGTICEGVWTPDPNNVGLTYDPCANTITVTEEGACGSFGLASNGQGNNPQCGAYTITLNINVIEISSPTIEGDQVICSGAQADTIKISTPGSGTNPLSYQWQTSTTSCDAGFADIAGATENYYVPPVNISQITYFRVVSSSSGNCVGGNCDVISNCVQIDPSGDCPEIDVALTHAVNTTASPGPYTPGDEVTFTTCVYNQGDISTSDLEVFLYLPSGASFDSYADFPTSSADGNPIVVTEDGAGSFSLNVLAEGDHVCVDVSLSLNDNLEEGAKVTSNAEVVSAAGGDDQDSPLSNQSGSSDDTSEMPTDNDIDDEAPNTPGTEDNVNDEDDYDPAQICIDAFDLALTHQVNTTDSPGPFIVGDEVTYTTCIYNQGSLGADNINVANYLPSNMSFENYEDLPVLSADGNAVVVTDNPQGNFIINTLAKGDHVCIDYTLSINSDVAAGVKITSNAEILSADGGLDEDSPLNDVKGSIDDTSEMPTDNDIDDEATDTPGTEDNALEQDDYDPAQICVDDFDLALTHSVNIDNTPTPYVAGANVNFETCIYNQGTLTAENIVVAAYIPLDANFDSYGVIPVMTENGNAVNITTDGNGGFSIDALPAGDQLCVEVILMVSPTTEPGDKLTSNAEIISADGGVDEDSPLDNVIGVVDDTSELPTDNNIDDEATGTPGTEDNLGDQDDYDPAQICIDDFDLALVHSVNTTASPGPYLNGSIVSFTTCVYNQGSLDATFIKVEEFIPDDISFDSYDVLPSSSNGGNFLLFLMDGNGGVTINNLKANDHVCYDIMLEINSDVPGGVKLTSNAEIIAAIGGVDEDSPLDDMIGFSDDTSELSTDNDIDDEASGTPGTEDNANEQDDYDPAQICVDEFDLALLHTVNASVSPGPYIAGDDVTFTTCVYNQGTRDASDIEVAAYLPSDASFDAYFDIPNLTADGNAISVSTDGQGGFTLDALAASDEVCVELTLTLSSDLEGGMKVTSNAEIVSANGGTDDDSPLDNVSGSVNDTAELATDNDIDDASPGTPGTEDNPNDEDDYDPAQICVDEFDLALVHSVNELISPIPYVAGEDIHYTTCVYNQGTLDANNIAVVEYLPSNMSFDSYGILPNTSQNGNTLSISADGIGGFTIDQLEDGDHVCVEVILTLSESVEAGDKATSNAEIIFAEGGDDEDSDLDLVIGAVNDTTELATDNELDDEGAGTPGTADNATEQDDYDPAQICVDEYDLAINHIVNTTNTPGPYIAGDEITFTTCVYNQGSLYAMEIEVVEYLPDHASFEAYADMPTLTADGLEVVVTPDGQGGFMLDSLKGGDEVCVEFNLSLDPTAEGGMMITSNAEIVAATGGVDEDSPLEDAIGQSNDTSEIGTDGDMDDEGDGTPGSEDNDADQDDYDPAQISVDEFDLALTHNVDPTFNPGPFIAGDEMAFTTCIHNQGTMEAQDIEVAMYVPSLTDFEDYVQLVNTTAQGNPVSISPDGLGGFIVNTLAANDYVCVSSIVSLDPSLEGDMLITSNAEIVNATGGEDEDSDLADVIGVTDDTSELPTDDDIDDEGNGTPGSSDNDAEQDDYDPAQIVIDEFDLAIVNSTNTTANPGPYVVGDVITFTACVYNQGTLDAANVDVVNYFPSFMSFEDYAALPTTTAQGAPVVILTDGNGNYTIDLLQEEDHVCIDVEVNLDPGAEGNMILTTNAEIVDAEGGDDEDNPLSDVIGFTDDTSELSTDDDIDDEGDGTPGSSDNAADQDDYDPAQILVDEFDLAIDNTINISVTPDPYVPNSVVNYTICTYNQGTLDASNIAVVDYVPDYLSFDSYGSLPTASVNGNAVSISTSGDGAFEIDQLLAMDQVCVELIFIIDTNTPQATVITNNVEIVSADGGVDEDSPLDLVIGSANDESEIATDGDLDDEASGTPGTTDNPNDQDDYDPSQLDVFIFTLDCPEFDGPDFSCLEDIPDAVTTESAFEALDPNADVNAYGTVYITYVDTDNGGEGCSTSVLFVTRTYTLLDDQDGNGPDADDPTLECSIQYKILDEEAPVFDALPAAMADIAYNESFPDFETLTATDNCGEVSISTSMDPYVVNLCGGYKVTYRWTAVDLCGNSTETTASFNVRPDTEAPVFDSMPLETVAIYCIEDLPLMEDLTATDGSGGTVLITTDITYGQGTSCSGYDVFYTWFATDDCGNESSVQCVIEVLPDELPPVFPIEPALMKDVECGETWPIQETLYPVDGCSELEPTIICDFHFDEQICTGYTVTYGWVTEDECGNRFTMVSSFNVLPDDKAPEFLSQPAPIADIDYGDPLPAHEDLEAVDNCTHAFVIPMVDPYSSDPVNGYEVTYRWVAVDDCGNSTDVSQSFFVRPDPNPIVFNNAPVQVDDIECHESLPAQQVLYAQDANGPVEVIASIDPYDVDLCNGYEVVYRWYAVNSLGQEAERTMRFNVLGDTTAPEFVSCPSDLQVLKGGAIPLTEPEVLDACDPDVIVSFEEELVASTDPSIHYTIYRKWVATDRCENRSECTQKIDVMPVLLADPSYEAPVLTGENTDPLDVHETSTSNTNTNTNTDVEIISTTQSSNIVAKDFTIFPNPAKSYTTVQMKNMISPNAVLTVYNTQGNAVSVYNVTKEQMEDGFRILLHEQLPEGLYFIKVASKEDYHTSTLILTN